ncbi:MAG TPA: heme o synthase [Roseiflexaceae bacterium]|nr:heme o synthase [Roseiflexaceae bacterium]
MPSEQILQTGSRVARTQRLLLASAAVAYALAVALGAAPALSATLLSALALAGLGAALFAYVGMRWGQTTPTRLGGRAAAALRRLHIVAFAVLSVVYLTLVAGALVANQGALWSCLALPICLAPGQSSSSAFQSFAVLATAHRVMAAVAAALVVGFSAWIMRSRGETALKRAAVWSIASMIAQVLLGMAQVVVARQGNGASLTALRVGHLAVGAGAWAALVVQVALALRLPRTEGRGPRTESNEAHSVLSRQSSVLKDYVSLTKPGVISLLILTTVASMYITPAGAPSLTLVLWTFAGGWLMAAGAHSVNCWADRDIDINMGRTSRRPIPSGRIPAWHALVLGIALGILAFGILLAFVNLAAALLSLAGYLYYVLIYTRWLKRTTPSNIVIGGGAGAFPPLVGWAAATGGLTLPALFLFAIIFYWTPPHFWALALIREKDYARASVPMLPVVAGSAETKRQILLYTILMLALTIMPTPLQMFGIPYLLMALGLGALFLRYVIRLLREDTTAAAWGLYKFSLLYLALLFGAMVLDRVVFS